MARRELDKWFWQVGEDLIAISQQPVARTQFWKPKADVYETEGAFVVRVELAGIDPDDLQLHYIPDKHSVLIRGKRAEPEFEQETPTGCHMLEIYFGDFEREVELPVVPVRGDQIRARFSHGLLVIQVPKATAAERKITLSVRKV